MVSCTRVFEFRNLIKLKKLFLIFFKEKFQKNDNMVTFPSITNSYGLCHFDCDLFEIDVSLEEIKMAVWDCGCDKAPDPNGFSFAFMKRNWKLLKMDILEYVNSFFTTRKMPSGSNSSIITLIPKVSNPNHIKDFRHISLIGIHYKSLPKFLLIGFPKWLIKLLVMSNPLSSRVAKLLMVRSCFVR